MIVSGHFSLPATLKYTIEVSGSSALTFIYDNQHPFIVPEKDQIVERGFFSEGPAEDAGPVSLVGLDVLAARHAAHRHQGERAFRGLVGPQFDGVEHRVARQRRVQEAVGCVRIALRYRYFSSIASTLISPRCSASRSRYVSSVQPSHAARCSGFSSSVNGNFAFISSPCI